MAKIAKQPQGKVEICDYQDTNGEYISVSHGGGAYFSVRHTGKATHRIKARDLPVRDTQDMAQVDLDAHAVKHGWRRVHGKN
jgi:hypothetical protein